MSLHTDTNQDENCSGCPVGGCKQRSQEAEGVLHGWQFVLASAGVFLTPIVLAIAGAVLLDDSDAMRALGGAAGLLTGLTISISVSRFLHQTKHEGKVSS